MNKKIQKSSIKIEWMLTITGLSVVILGCLSSIFYASVNQRFIFDIFPSIIYYLNYLVVLGGGFIVGYVATRPRNGNRQSRLFSAVCYAFLAAALFNVYELIRVFTNDTLGSFAYPAGRYTFELGPLVSLVVTGVIAFVLQARNKVVGFSTGAAWTLIAAFIGYQAYSLIQSIYYITVESSTISFADSPLWIIVLSYVLNPLVVAAISFYALSRVTSRPSRLLYASLVGSFSTWLINVLWNFNTDPSHESAMVFQAFVATITLIATALLILKLRTASKNK